MFFLLLIFVLLVKLGNKFLEAHVLGLGRSESIRNLTALAMPQFVAFLAGLASLES